MTSISLSGHNSRPLQDWDIEIAYGDESRIVKLTIRQSKADMLGLKTTLFLSETEDLACPVSSVSNFGQSLPRQYQTLGNFWSILMVIP